MKKTRVAVGSTIHSVDTIEHDGQLWLVPVWVDSPDGKWTRPLRMISLANLQPQTFQDGYFLPKPLPPELLSGEIAPLPAILGIVVLEAPDIVLPNPRAVH